MSELDKQTFKAIVEEIIEGFEAPDFKTALGAAMQAGDVAQIGALAMKVQTGAFSHHGLDPVGGTASFKAAGKRFGLDPELAPLLARMKAALS